MALTEPITTCYCTGCKERQDTIDRLKAELAAAREDRKCENTDCSNIIDGNQNPGVCLACWNRVAVENSKLRALCRMPWPLRSTARKKRLKTAWM